MKFQFNIVFTHRVQFYHFLVFCKGRDFFFTVLVHVLICIGVMMALK